MRYYYCGNHYLIKVMNKKITHFGNEPEKNKYLSEPCMVDKCKRKATLYEEID